MPPTPTAFLPPLGDPNGAIARDIARRVSRFPNLRGDIAGATWTIDESAVWRVRRRRDCMAELRRLGVRAHPWEEPLTTPVPSPVEIFDAIGGVRFYPAREGEPIVVSCELAARLPALVAILRRHDVRSIAVLSALRDHPITSFHTMGLALDVSRLHSRSLGLLDVERDFAITYDQETCAAPPPAGPRAAALLAIACDIAAARIFQSVLTPNYNLGHRNHFHLDMRPDDPRFFVR
jgi:hypothetical protein